MNKTNSFIIIWTFIGFLLNVISNFTPFELPIYDLADNTNTTYLRMGISLQVATNLFVSCVSGPIAAKYAQLLYFAMGIVGEPLYMTGGTYDMFQEPSFGYVLGSFWATDKVGKKVFETKLSLLNILQSSYIGLFTIHFGGFIGLLLFSRTSDIWRAYLIKYSVIPFPSQVILIFFTSILAFLFRKVID